MDVASLNSCYFSNIKTLNDHISLFSQEIISARSEAIGGSQSELLGIYY